jgi:RNA polymerase sigma-70 factor (ECF subfamily)
MDDKSVNDPRAAGEATAAGPLIEAARVGCNRSLGELTERYRRYLLLVANNELSPELRIKMAPSDLVQETLIHVAANFNRFAGSSEQELLAWLRRIMHFRAVHAARRFYDVSARNINREAPLATGDDSQAAPIADQSPTPLTTLLAFEELAALGSALAELDEPSRRVILLRSVERKSFSEIGQTLACSEAAARKRWVRAVNSIRTTLNGHESAR